eukprot:GEMP01047944.1.p1 GENE.GEMP01047944.1~~GEMP01047944.1.p1  ORF type:complete len:148 (+),score=27.74 GEMP01047944.1:89-532(+)
MWPILDPVVEVLRVDVTVSLCRVHGLTSLMCVVIGLGKVEQRKVEKDRKAEAISFPAVTIASAYPPPGEVIRIELFDSDDSLTQVEYIGGVTVECPMAAKKVYLCRRTSLQEATLRNGFAISSNRSDPIPMLLCLNSEFDDVILLRK